MVSEQIYSAMNIIFSTVKTLLFILGCYEERVKGILTLSPMTVAPVCHIGDPLQITCTVSVEFIRWSIWQANEQGTLVEVINSVLITASDANQMTHRVVNSATFTFMRSSAEDTTPLISTLSIDSVNIGFNGTVVHCLEVGGSMTSASTTIQIIDIDLYNISTPILTIKPEEYYEAENVTVTVEWVQQVGAVYSARISPMDQVLIINESTPTLQLVLEYNTEYNLSVVAISPCGSNATASTTLNYANCGHPELQVLSTNDSVPRVTVDGSDDILSIEGITVTFSCPPGMALIGPNSATCTENGEWEPDPSGLQCTAACEDLLVSQSMESSLCILGYSKPAVVGTTISFSCSQPGEILVGPNTAICMEDGQWVPDLNHLEISCKVSCGTPETDTSVHSSSYNSTLEGSTLTFQCSDIQLSTEAFISMCHRNASWVPNPVSHCATLRSDGEILDKAAATAGSLLGALVAVLLILLTAVGIVIFIKKDSLWRHYIHGKSTIVQNIELNYVAHEQDTAENIVYAIVGPFSSSQSQTPKLDKDRVEYAKINYSVMTQNPTPALLVEKATDEESDTSLNLDSLLIHLQGKVSQKWHQLGVALEVEKEILDRCLNYSPEQSIVEMLDHWLGNCDLEKQNWREIARALRQIKYHQLAKEIEIIDKSEPNDVPGVELQQSTKSDQTDVSPSLIPPKKTHDFKDNPEDFEHRDVIKYNLPA